MTEQAGNKAGCVCSRVKRNILNTLTEPTWQRVGRAWGSTRWEEHAEPRWHRLDRACSRRRTLLTEQSGDRSVRAFSRKKKDLVFLLSN